LIFHTVCYIDSIGIIDLKGLIVMSSFGTIFGLQPFEPKRLIFLPWEGGIIQLFVLDGKAYPITNPGHRERKTFDCVHFDGWAAGFQNAKLDIPTECLVHPKEGLSHYALEVAFHLIPVDGRNPRPEIVAVSFDSCKTFYNNELSTLPKEYE
jgi:hypothetical protein